MDDWAGQETPGSKQFADLGLVWLGCFFIICNYENERLRVWRGRVGALAGCCMWESGLWEGENGAGQQTEWRAGCVALRGRENGPVPKDS